jgi:hypothetical protein
MPKYRSATTTHGRNMAGARALWPHLSSVSPVNRPKKACWIRAVIGPRLPSPTWIRYSARALSDAREPILTGVNRACLSTVPPLPPTAVTFGFASEQTKEGLLDTGSNRAALAFANLDTVNATFCSLAKPKTNGAG